MERSFLDEENPDIQNLRTPLNGRRQTELNLQHDSNPQQNPQFAGMDEMTKQYVKERIKTVRDLEKKQLVAEAEIERLKLLIEEQSVNYNDTPYEPLKKSNRLKRQTLIENISPIESIDQRQHNVMTQQNSNMFNPFLNPNYVNPCNPYQAQNMYPNPNLNQSAYPNIPYMNPVSTFQQMNPYAFGFPQTGQSFTNYIPAQNHNVNSAKSKNQTNSNNSTMVSTDKGNLNITINKESKYDEVPKLKSLTDLNWGNRMWEYLNVKYTNEEWSDADLKKAIYKGLNNHNTPITSSIFPNWMSYFMAVLACIGQKLGSNDNLQILKNVRQKKNESVAEFNARFTEALYNCGTPVPPSIASDYYFDAINQDLAEKVETAILPNCSISDVLLQAVKIENIMNRKNRDDDKGRKDKKSVYNLEGEDDTVGEVNMIQFNGNCLVCGRYGHRAKDCRSVTNNNNNNNNNSNNSYGRGRENNYNNNNNYRGSGSNNRGNFNRGGFRGSYRGNGRGRGSNGNYMKEEPNNNNASNNGSIKEGTELVFRVEGDKITVSNRNINQGSSTQVSGNQGHSSST